MLAPTGTISFLMDCDTTGIEPDFSLVKFKELVGGGQMKIVNGSVDLALETLGYSESEVEQIDAYINEHNTIIGAPGLKDEHLEVFDVAVGERSISHTGHIDMMAAAQPFLSGAISKTVNLPESATVVRHRRRLQRRLEEGPQGSGDLSRRLEDRAGAEDRRRREEGRRRPRSCERRARSASKMPRERESITHKFSIGMQEGYITAGKYEDGSVGEIFLTDIGKEGSTIKGLMNAFATAISMGLQYGVPLEDYVKQVQLHALRAGGHHPQPGDPLREVDARLHHALARQPVHRRRRLPREPRDPDRRGPRQEGCAAGLPDGRHRRPQRWNGHSNGEGNGERERLAERLRRRPTAEAKPATAALTDTPPVVPAKMGADLELGPACDQCGGMMQRTGSCYTCSSCGNNTGCG